MKKLMMVITVVMMMFVFTTTPVENVKYCTEVVRDGLGEHIIHLRIEIREFGNKCETIGTEYRLRSDPDYGKAIVGF